MSGKVDFASIEKFDREKLKVMYKNLDPYRYWGNGVRKFQRNHMKN